MESALEELFQIFNLCSMPRVDVRGTIDFGVDCYLEQLKDLYAVYWAKEQRGMGSNALFFIGEPGITLVRLVT